MDGEPQLLPDATRILALTDVPWGPIHVIEIDSLLELVAIPES